MRKRLITAAVGLPLLILIIARAAPEWVFVFFCILEFCTAMEIMRLFVGQPPVPDSTRPLPGFRRRDAGLALLSLCIFIAEEHLRHAVGASTVFHACLVVVLLVAVLPEGTIAVRVERVSQLSLAFLYACLPWMALWDLYGYAEHGFYILVLLATAWSGDTAAFFIGKRWGKTRLAPVVSPRKTWLGAGAGLVGSLLGILSMKAFRQEALPAWPQVLVLGLILALAGQAGDHFKSVFKRYQKVKDAGQLLPGHGGLLDRLDSVLLAAPLMHLTLDAFGISHGCWLKSVGFAWDFPLHACFPPQ